MYIVRFSKKAENTLKKIDPVMRRRMLSKMENLTQAPKKGPNIKKYKAL